MQVLNCAATTIQSWGVASLEQMTMQMGSAGFTALLDVQKEDFASELGMAMSVIVIVDFMALTFFFSNSPMQFHALLCIK